MCLQDFFQHFGAWKTWGGILSTVPCLMPVCLSKSVAVSTPGAPPAFPVLTLFSNSTSNPETQAAISSLCWTTVSISCTCSYFSLSSMLSAGNIQTTHLITSQQNPVLWIPLLLEKKSNFSGPQRHAMFTYFSSSFLTTLFLSLSFYLLFFFLISFPSLFLFPSLTPTHPLPQVNYIHQLYSMLYSCTHSLYRDFFFFTCFCFSLPSLLSL